MAHPTQTAIGTWSGGRFMHFGEPLDDERLLALLTPDDRDPHGDRPPTRTAPATPTACSAARSTACRATTTCSSARSATTSTRASAQGAKGFPRFTDPALRGPDDYAVYLRRATEASLERCGVDRFDLLLLHNPDRTGYTSEAVWDGMAALRDAGLTDLIGVAPGPANGFTLDLIDCFERFGDRIDWAMVILNPLEPWPGELALPAAAAHDVQVITRVVDYGGLFGGDLRDPARARPARPPRLPPRRLDRGAG